MTPASFEHVYRYAASSAVVSAPGGAALRLATSGGEDAHPFFFEGVLVEPRLTSQLLTGLAQVVGSRFAIHPSMFDWWEAHWETRTYLEPLAEPETVLTPTALLLLALGLAAKEPGEHGLVVDAFVAGVRDGRLDARRLGETMARLLPTGIVKAARLAATLGTAAKVSPAHARAARAAITEALRGDPGSAPRDLASLLECLVELIAETGGGALDDPDARAFVDGLARTGKTGKLRAGLLASSA